MSLVFWTGADAKAIDATFGKSLKGFKPDIPPHRFEEFKPGWVPFPKEGELVLTCGKKLLDKLAEHKITPKGRAVAGMRGKLIKYQGGGHFMVTYDPGIINSEPHHSQTLDWDVRLATRFLRTGTLKPTVGAYKYVGSYRPLIAEIKRRYALNKLPVDLSVDTETETFHPWYEDREIVSISFTLDSGTAEVLYTGRQDRPVPHDSVEDLSDQVHWLLTSPMVKMRAANGKYDFIWIAEKWGIECTNFTFDLLLAASLCNENRTNNLNNIAKIASSIGGYDDEFNDTIDKNKMGELPPDEKFLTYAGGDTDSLQQASEVIKDELLSDPKLARFYVTILHPAAMAFQKIERRGLLVDAEKLSDLGDTLDKQIKETERKLLDMVPNVLKLKHHEKIKSQRMLGKDPFTNAILRDLFFTKDGFNIKPVMFTPSKEEPSTAGAHLRMFLDHPKAGAFVMAMEGYGVEIKTVSTFIRGFLKHLRPDGRFHPSYMLYHGVFDNDQEKESGSVSGRLSAKDPAVQTIPKKTKMAKLLRACYIAPPGKVVLNCDYSQGELKVVACVAPEPTMIAAYEQGLDLHAVTGAQIANIDLALFLSYKDHVDKELAAIFDGARDRAKPANFGLLYGMSAEGFRQYAWASYKRKFTAAEAEAIREAFFKLYPGLLNYHENMKNFVKLHQHVRSPLGRVRHLPTIKSWDSSTRAYAERQAINSPVQATLTDMMIWAIALIEDANLPSLEIVAMIHDAFVAYVDIDKAEFVAAQVTKIMRHLPFEELDWNPVLPFTADAEIGPNLADLKKLKLAA